MKLPGLIAEPDPVAEGGEVSVDYQGEGTLYYSVDGGPWIEVPLDGGGKGSVEAPQGARALVFSDRITPGGLEAFVEVYSTGV